MVSDSYYIGIKKEVMLLIEVSIRWFLLSQTIDILRIFLRETKKLNTMNDLKGKIVVDEGKEKEKKEFSFTKDVDGVSKTVRGEQVENGWIITISKEWKEKMPNGNTDYKYENKKYVSKENPMDKLEKEMDKKPKEDNAILDTFKDVMNSSGMLLVE